MAAAVLLLLTILGGCRGTSESRLPPPWPAAARTPLDVELRATADELALPPPPSAADESSGAPPDSRFVKALEGEAAGLTYIEVVLGDDVPVDAALPMVLMLHGRGDRPKIPAGPFACVPAPMRIIMPRAPEPLGPGYTWLAVRVAEGRTDELTEELALRADQLAQLLEAVVAKRPTTGKPLVTGFSQGGLLAFALAVRHPSGIGAALPLAGWLPPGLWPTSSEGLPMIRSLHGMDDDTIPLAPTRAAVAHLRELGADVELVEYEGVGHEMTVPMDAQFQRWLEGLLRVQPASPLKGPVAIAEDDRASECR